jgi:hypothetical protein
MSRFCFMLVLCLATVSTIAQNKPGESSELPKDSVLRAALSPSGSLDAEHSKIGDPIRLNVLGLVAGGKVKRPRQPLTLVGHIAEVGIRTPNQPESRLGIAFDKILIGSLTGERELTVSAVIQRVMTVKEPAANRTSSVPTSGDDPVQRAAGPMVDSSGRSVYSPSPLSQPGPGALSAQFPYEAPVKDVSLRPDDSTNTTVIVCKKRNIVLEPETVMIVRVTSSGK